MFMSFFTYRSIMQLAPYDIWAAHKNTPVGLGWHAASLIIIDHTSFDPPSVAAQNNTDVLPLRAKTMLGGES
jgi:hypothetical protein